MKKTNLSRIEKRRKKIKRGLLISFFSTIILLASVGGYFIHLYNQFGDNVYQNKGKNQDQNNGTEEQIKEAPNPFGISDLFANTFDKPMTILVLGLDSRQGESLKTARTDTIMIMTINPKTKQIATVSFPRDSYVMLPQLDHQKINSAMYYGGIPLLKSTIEYNFDVNIDHYVAVDFVAFEKIVDLLGGLDVYTPSSMYYVASDIHVELKPGTHHLNGEELLGYVRYRHDSDGDLGRIKRQQFAIRALGEKATELKNMIKVPQLLNILGKNIITDINKTDMYSIIKTYRNFSKSDWHPLTLGGEVARSSKDNLWYYFYTEKDRQQVTSFVQRYLNGK